MADINPYIDPTTNDYVLVNGAIQNNNSLLSEFYFRVNTPLGSYIYDKTFGNELLNLQYSPSIQEIQQSLTNAVAPLINNQRIKNLQISVLVRIATAYSALMQAIDNTGQPIQYKWQKLNV